MRKTKPARPMKTSFRTILILWALLSSFLACPGCGHISGYLGFLQRQRSLENAFQNQPRVELLREISPEGCFRLQGEIVLGRQQDTPLLAVVVLPG